MSLVAYFWAVWRFAAFAIGACALALDATGFNFGVLPAALILVSLLSVSGKKRIAGKSMAVRLSQGSGALGTRQRLLCLVVAASAMVAMVVGIVAAITLLGLGRNISPLISVNSSLLLVILSAVMMAVLEFVAVKLEWFRG